MSSHPNSIIIASIRPPNGLADTFINDENPEVIVGDVLYEAITYESTDLAIYPEEGYFCIYEYLTYGWGETIELHKALAKIAEFKEIVEDYCKTNNCTCKFHLSANFW